MLEGVSVVPADRRRELPDEPGVYLFRNERGKVIYVGKAKSIRKRVASHFSNPSTRGGKDLVDMIDQVEALVVHTEAEALLAEQNFIKQYKPRFNIRLRDDKSYPYIAISLDEDFPRVYFTRERHRRDRAYFGPYSNAKRVRSTLEVLGKVFMFRSCEGPEPGRRSGSPCLDYYIKRCEAPCVGYVTREEYRNGIDGVIDFLSGRYRDIERSLARSMREAAAEQRFEDAARERNRLRAVHSLLERQRVANESTGTLDAIAVAVHEVEANAQVFQVRDGVLSDRQSFYLDNEAHGGIGEVAEAFILQYYTSAMMVPPLLIVQHELAATDALKEALTTRRGGMVEIRAPERGDKRRILELAERNARLALDQERLRSERRRQQRVEALDGLQQTLRLDALPLRIECFDISTLMGTNTVASMVVFEGGAPKKSDYRRFKIRGDIDSHGDGNGAGRIGEPDDFAAMEEVLSRRLAQWERQRDLSPHDKDYDPSFAALPNLIVIDGGRGQLSAGLRALHAFRERAVFVISLAKRIEEVFTPGSSEPLRLPHDTVELQLLQRVRDEAHRFAITHHRIRRDRAMTASILDELPGVGPARKRALLNHFGSPDAILAASREELEAVPGIPGKLAREVYRELHKTGV
ncbi:MAG: excinuclease ABC subunit UvrC [Solirubrobacterales bacterium]|nr:excinuclease ABC subunit UvrC [Solirubrobacterales bacterium]MBV9943882.1 excinuclease ABC subunit UvrC [Solirubrobacterales bacterium]